MKFKRGNRITYFQDFHACTGLPSDVDFDVKRVNHGGVEGYDLRADGHGGDVYGNGAIHIRPHMVSSSVVHRLRIATA